MSQFLHVKLFRMFHNTWLIILSCSVIQNKDSPLLFYFLKVTTTTPNSKDIVIQIQNNLTFNSFSWLQPNLEPCIKVLLFAPVDKIHVSDHSFYWVVFTLFGKMFSYTPAVQSGSCTGLKDILKSAACSSADKDWGLET